MYDLQIKYKPKRNVVIAGMLYEQKGSTANAKGRNCTYQFDLKKSPKPKTSLFSDNIRM